MSHSTTKEEKSDIGHERKDSSIPASGDYQSERTMSPSSKVIFQKVPTKPTTHHLITSHESQEADTPSL